LPHPKSLNLVKKIISKYSTSRTSPLQLKFDQEKDFKLLKNASALGEDKIPSRKRFYHVQSLWLIPGVKIWLIKRFYNIQELCLVVGVEVRFERKGSKYFKLCLTLRVQVLSRKIILKYVGSMPRPIVKIAFRK